MTLVLRHVSLRLAGSCLSGSREGMNSLVFGCWQVLNKPALQLGGCNMVRIRPQRCTHAHSYIYVGHLSPWRSEQYCTAKVLWLPRICGIYTRIT